jgi:hypothetical protein
MRKTIKLFSLMATLVLAMVSKSVLADAAPAATPTPAPTPAVSVNGFVDGYYTYNFTNTGAAMGKGNVGYNFNLFDETFNLGLAEVDVNAVLGSTSGHLSLVAGDTNTAIFGSTSLVPFVLQAYASYAPGQWTFNLGRFATWMGNEVIQSKSNMNYSRSLLFVYTIPYFNQGLSAGWASSDSKVGITGYMTQGWNNNGVLFSGGAMGDGADLGKTYGLEAKFNPDSTFGVVLNGIIGPNGSTGGNINPDQTKWVGEAIISFVPNSTLSFALDAEYGSTNTGAVTFTARDGTTKYSAAPFWGAALYGRYQIASDWAAALRLEQVVDTYGYALALYGLTPQFNPGTGKGTNDVTADEVTLTVEHNLSSNLLFRAEGRLDMATSGGTAYGATSATLGVGSTFAGASNSQLTGTASAVMSF